MNRFLAAVLLAAVAAAQTSSQQIAAHITANALKADVSFLASDALEGRGTPSTGLDIAAEFIASQFRRAGLEPAGDDGYFQTAPYVSVTPNPEGLELTIETGGQVVRADKAALALQEAAAADLSHTAAIKVPMSDPAALEALKPEQTRGKVLLLQLPDSGGGRGGTFAVMRRVQTAVPRLQPALVVLVRSGAQAVNRNARLLPASAAMVPTLVVWDAAIRSALDAGGEVAVSAHIPAPAVKPVKLHNVIGVLRGSDPVLKDTYLLFTAHYDHLGVRGSGEGDHINNGANDDASGTASVLEIAGALAALPSWPKRSLVFLTFFGEELGELGSRYYVQHPVFPLAKTVVDVNLEQLGRTDETSGPRVGQFNLTGFDYTNLPAVFRQAGQETGIQVVKDEKNSDNYFGASDNAAFADAGVPSTTLSVTYSFPDYHRPGDEWPKLDYDNMAMVDRTIALAALLLANGAETPQWNAANPKTERFIHARASAAGGTRQQ